MGHARQTVPHGHRNKGVGDRLFRAAAHLQRGGPAQLHPAVAAHQQRRRHADHGPAVLLQVRQRRRAGRAHVQVLENAVSRPTIDCSRAARQNACLR